MGFFTDRALPLHTLSRAMQGVYDAGVRAAKSEANILIVGEDGVGKNTMAYRLHELSARAGKAMVSFSCASMSERLIESELFGYESGTFPGAGPARPGLLETAHGGTVLLDEVGYLPPALQEILNRAVETREVLRAGGGQPRPIDVRFIAVTEQNLEPEIACGKFRQDLYIRLSEVSLVIPPLRERRSEIQELARIFVAEQCLAEGRPELPVAPAAMTFLNERGWCSNILELKYKMQQAVILCDGAEIGLEHLTIGR